MPVEHVAVHGGDLGDTVGLDRATARRDRGEGARHVDQPHIGGAEHHRGIGPDRGGDPEASCHRGDRAEADLVAELRGHGVLRIGEGGADIDFAGVGTARIVRAPAIDRHWLVDDLVVGRVAGLQRREIDEQFPRRARLAHRVDRAVVIARDVIGAADEGEHRAVAVEADQRALRAFGCIRLDRGARLFLHFRIERGPHFERLVGFRAAANRAAAAPSR